MTRINTLCRKVFGHRTLRYYGEQKALGRALPHTLPTGVEDNILQMGGDFTLNCTKGHVTMVHPSQSPIDRPIVSHLIKYIDEDS